MHPPADGIAVDLRAVVGAIWVDERRGPRSPRRDEQHTSWSGAAEQESRRSGCPLPRGERGAILCVVVRPDLAPADVPDQASMRLIATRGKGVREAAGEERDGLPAVQPLPAPHRAREPDEGPRSGTHAAEGGGVATSHRHARGRWPCRSEPRLPQSAVWRTATARRYHTCGPSSVAKLPYFEMSGWWGRQAPGGLLGPVPGDGLRSDLVKYPRRYSSARYLDAFQRSAGSSPWRWSPTILVWLLGPAGPSIQDICGSRRESLAGGRHRIRRCPRGATDGSGRHPPVASGRSSQVIPRAKCRADWDALSGRSDASRRRLRKNPKWDTLNWGCWDDSHISAPVAPSGECLAEEEQREGC